MDLVHLDLARCALIQPKNKRSFIKASTDVMAKINLSFYKDMMTATFKGLDLNWSSMPSLGFNCLLGPFSLRL